MTGIILNGGGGVRRTRRKRQDSRQNKNSAEECEYSFANRLPDMAVKTKKKDVEKYPQILPATAQVSMVSMGALVGPSPIPGLLS